MGADDDELRGAAKFLGGGRKKKGGGCSHPPRRLYGWEARDDRYKGGFVFIVACCECGAVLRNAKPLEGEDDGS